MRALVVGLVLLSVQVAHARRPRGETAEQEVERLAAEGVQAYKAEKYDEAIAVLNRAYAIRPLAALLYNLAKAYDKQGNMTDACATWKKYTDAPDADLKLRVKALEKVDGCEAARKAMEAPPTVPQPAAEAPPGKTNLPQGEPTQLDLDRQAEAEQKKRKRYFLYGAIGAGALGLAGLGAGVGLYASASSTHDEFTRSLDEDQKRVLRDEGASTSAASIAMYSVGALFLAGSGVLFYFALKPEGLPPPSSPPPVTFIPLVGPRGAGAEVTWRF